MGYLKRTLEPGLAFTCNHYKIAGDLNIHLIGKAPTNKPFLWIGDDRGCIGTLDEKATHTFLVKAIAQIIPGARIVVPKKKGK